MYRSAVALLATATVLATAPAHAAGTHTVRVKAKDFSFTLSTNTVPHGSVVFVLENVGHTAHDFSIAGHKSRTIGPGKSTRLVVTLEKGRHPYKCTVDAHAKLGMKGIFVVS